MKIRFMVLMFALMSVFLISFSSAALVLEAASIPTNVNHNQGNIQVLFTLKNTGTSSQTGLVWTKNSNIGEWTVVPSLTEINAGAELSLSAILTIPKYSNGAINANIKVESGANQESNLPVQIQITESGQLSVKTETGAEEVTLNQSGRIKVENIGNTNLNNIELSSSGAFDVTFSQNNFALNPFALNPGASKTITVSGTSFLNLKFGKNTVTVTAKDTITGVQASTTLSHSNSFCKAGKAGGNLSISKVEKNSDGDKDDEWKVLDTIDIEVKVENEGDDDIDNVEVHLGLFDSNGKDQASDLEFENADEEKIELGDLNDGDDDTVNFKFRVPADFESGDYKLALKAFSDDLGETAECTDVSDDLSDTFFDEIKIEKQDDEGKFIAFDNIEIAPTEEVTCGDTVTINIDVFNVGDKDQDQVRINLKSPELKLNLNRELRQDLDQGDKEKVSFTFIVPTGLKDKVYNLELSADYDYKRGAYRESSDKETTFGLNVIGCSLVPLGGEPGEEKIAIIGASLQSDAVQGEDLIVKASVTSLLSGENSFVVKATGFDEWASLDSVSEQVFVLKEGESKDVLLNFKVKDDVDGENSFIFEVKSGDASAAREVAVNIGLGEGAPAGGFNFGDNSLIWIIGIINVILIVLIIIVAVRISRR